MPAGPASGWCRRAPVEWHGKMLKEMTSVVAGIGWCAAGGGPCANGATQRPPSAAGRSAGRCEDESLIDGTIGTVLSLRSHGNGACRRLGGGPSVTVRGTDHGLRSSRLLRTHATVRSRGRRLGGIGRQAAASRRPEGKRVPVRDNRRGGNGTWAQAASRISARRLSPWLRFTPSTEGAYGTANASGTTGRDLPWPGTQA